MAQKNSQLLKEYLNCDIPENSYVFRRVHIDLFKNGRPEHRLDIVPHIFRNEKDISGCC